MTTSRVMNIRYKSGIEKPYPIRGRLIKVKVYKIWFRNSTRDYAAEYDWEVSGLVCASGRILRKTRREAFICRKNHINKLRNIGGIYDN